MTQTLNQPGTTARLISADAVRVWRGFRNPAMALPDFFNRLNTVFIPATVQMQIDAGLDCYLPAVPAGLAGKPDTVPDETAILFWDSQETYTDGFKTLAVRTYTLTHAAVYATGSRADFPQPFAGVVVADQPYYLSNEPADWMGGRVWHILGSRPAAQSPEEFMTQCAAGLSARQKSGGFAGAIACCGKDYFAYWELRTGSDAPAQPDALFQAVGAATEWRYATAAQNTPVDHGLWEQWPGMDVASGDFINTQFRRRWEQ